MGWVRLQRCLESSFHATSTLATRLNKLLAFCRINKPGGCAIITKVHYTMGGLHVESIDVKYVLGGGFEKEIDPAIVSPYESLKREGRKRRGRDFLMDRADDVLKKIKQAMSQKKTKKKAGGAGVAHRTPAQPDHSTSPSTPVTPEHPSAAAKAAKAAKKPLVTSTTTVPSFVIADSTSVEVSPLQDPINRTTDVPTKSTIARRGLFGVSKKTTQERSNPAKANPKKKVTPVDAADDTSSGTSSSSSASSPLAPQTSQEVQRAHSAAVKQSLSKKQNKFMTKNTRLTDHNHQTAVASCPNRKASLQNVFDQELRKAREFLDEVCRAPLKDEVVVDPTSKQSRLDTSGSEADEPDRKPAAA